MNVKVIKHLTEQFSLEQLSAAEESILEGVNPDIEVEGKDEGEQLTHVLAAIYCKNEMSENSASLNEAIRNYSKKVRTSIDIS